MSGGRRFGRGKVSEVTLGDGLWLGAVLIAASLPLMGAVGFPVVACFITAILLFLNGLREAKGVSRLVLWGMLLIGAGVVWFVHGSVVGMEPGVALFLGLFGVKILELRRARDYRVALSLGYFLLLCNLFISSELSVSLIVGCLFLVLGMTLHRFHFGNARHGSQALRIATGQVAKILVQGAPIILLLFFFFPRAPQGFGVQLFRKQTTGMSDELRPGTVEELVADGSLAFRVRFLGYDPKQSPYYWRGVVLWQSRGLEWYRGGFRDMLAQGTTGRQGRWIHQEVILEPHGGYWLLALDQPLMGPERSRLQLGRYLLSRTRVDQRRLYEAFSGELVEPLSQMERAMALRLPRDEGAISQRLWDLADSWKGTPREKVAAAQRFFSSGGFQYTLSSGGYGHRDGWEMLDEFIFNRKVGFCSHYAAAYSSLMRMAGIPSRTIIGYAGGEWNPIGGFYSIYQSDAHAWSEVWLEDEGWVRIDPTRFVPGAAGQTPALPLQAVEEETAGDAVQGDFGGEGFLQMRRLSYQWAAINYRWTLWVLGYDHDVQREFFNSIGLYRFRTATIFLASLLAAGAVMAALWWWLRRPPAAEPLEMAYRQLGLKLARLGMERKPGETPAAYCERVVNLRPDLRPVLEPLFSRYALLRYAPWKLAVPEEDLAGFCREVAAFKPAKTVPEPVA